MAKISRFFLKLFGTSGTDDNFGRFGSAAAGSQVFTKDPASIQSLNAWLNGWQDAVNPSNKAAFLEDMNSIFLVMCRAMSYQFQEGIPEWETGTTYFTNSIVKDVNTLDLYASLIDNNVGNSLPSQVDNANWKYLGNLVTLNTNLPAGAMMDYGGTAAPSGWLGCDGSAVSRTTYARLFSSVGTTWGIGDGATTFNLPDFRRRVAVGSGGSGSGTLANSVGSTGGEETHTLTAAELPVVSPAGSYLKRPGSGGDFQVAANVGTTDKFDSLPSFGSGSAHNVIQPSAVVLKIIKT